MTPFLLLGRGRTKNASEEAFFRGEEREERERKREKREKRRSRQVGCFPFFETSASFIKLAAFAFIQNHFVMLSNFWAERRQREGGRERDRDQGRKERERERERERESKEEV